MLPIALASNYLGKARVPVEARVDREGPGGVLHSKRFERVKKRDRCKCVSGGA